MFPQLLLFVLSVQKCYGAIYHLNESEYRRMPPVFHLDDFTSCVDLGGRYCTVDFHIVSDTPSELLTMIREYSAHISTHFNHTKLQYGICVTHTCKHIQQRNTTLDLRETLEECLNDTLWRDYELKTKVDQIKCNEDSNIMDEIDVVDMAVGAISFGLVVLNVIGSLQEFFVDEKSQGNKFLSCFSLKRNWKILVAEPKPTDSVTEGLKGFYGVRTMSMALVISCHSLLLFVISSENTREWEEQTYIWIKFIANGTLVVQTFFVLSGFLLAYNMQKLSEKVTLKASMLPMKIFMRWLRLAPSYFFMLAITATLIRFAESGAGPLWQTAIGQGIADCRRDWWLVLLYVINYVDESQCMAETWYLAADLQLTILGLVLFMLAKGKARLVVMMLICLAGVAAPAIHTYLEDLEASVLFAPEIGRNFYTKDPTFNKVYKRGHTNVVCYLQGMAAGLLVHHWQTTGVNLRKYPKLRFVMWAIVPMGVATVLSGGVFYADGARAPLYARTLVAALLKPVFGTFVFSFFVGLAFQVETVYRGILSWRGWVVPARLSYCAYILHMFLIRSLVGYRSTLVHVSAQNIIITFICVVHVSFVVALSLWLLVEAPVTNVLKLLISWLGWMPRNLEEKKPELANNDANGTDVENAAPTTMCLNIATKL